MGSKKQFRVACISTVARACSSCVRIVTQSLWRVGTLEYIRPAKYAVKIPSRLGVLGKKLNFFIRCGFIREKEEEGRLPPVIRTDLGENVCIMFGPLSTP